MLCCESTTDSNAIQGNKRFWALRDEGVAEKTWKREKEIGIKGVEEDRVYIEEIRAIEVRDIEIRRLKEGKFKKVPCISCPTIVGDVIIQLK